MPNSTPTEAYNEAKALQSLGSSSEAIYKTVARALRSRGISGGTVVDVGCGSGGLKPYIADQFSRYIGLDLVKYDGFPQEVEFYQVDLETQTINLPSSLADVAVSVETIEHLENPRAFFREITRIVRPNGYILLTTPNQLSMLSLLTLLIKKRFSSFQDIHYPAHLTALLEIDLQRMAQEAGLEDVSTAFTHSGRVGLTPWHYPKWLSSAFPRLLSDNVLLIGKKPPPQRARKESIDATSVSHNSDETLPLSAKANRK